MNDKWTENKIYLESKHEETDKEDSEHEEIAKSESSSQKEEDITPEEKQPIKEEKLMPSLQINNIAAGRIFFV